MAEKSYWEERDPQNALRVYEYTNDQGKMVTRWFNRSLKEMDQKIVSFYRNYADSNGLTLPQAKQAVNDLGSIKKLTLDYENLVARYPDDEVARQLLGRLHAHRQVSREEFLQMQLQSLATQLYGDYEDATTQAITKTFEENYYKTMFDYQQYVGFGSSFNRISTHFILSATSTAWSGKNYSEILWGSHRTSLARYLNRIITNGFTQGNSNQMMTAELRKAMDMGSFEARRLIRTEGNSVASRGNLLSYLENGTEEYEVLATLDFKTSVICRGKDGKVYLVTEAVPGVTMPPFHPFCRTTTVPHIPDEEFDRGTTRAARSGTGATYRVPASMEYDDWYQKYVASNKAEMLLETKYKNGMGDSNQWSSYKDRLGKNAPRSLDAFQNIKYTDAATWYKLQRHYRGMGYILAGKNTTLIAG